MKIYTLTCACCGAERSVVVAANVRPAGELAVEYFTARGWRPTSNGPVCSDECGCALARPVAAVINDTRLAA
jgi:hypothetical protein